MLHPIDHLLQQPEGETLEFKRDLWSPRNVLKTLVAFANAAGGSLVIGVDDARQVLGVSDPLDEEARICNLIADGIAPRLVPSVELASVGDRTLLIVEVFPSSARPHYLNSLGPEQGVYVRLGASNRQTGPDWIAETHRATAGQVFDEQPMPELGLDDLDTTAMARVFRELGLIEQWGSGIRRIFDEAKQQALPEPVIEEIASGVRLRIRLAQQHALERPPSDTRQDKDDDRASLSRLESQLESRLESKLAAKIVLHLGIQPSGKAELARALGHTTVSGELHKQIRRLLDLSLIEMTMPDKPNSRLQRYRLTQTGRQLFDPIEGKTT